MGAAKRIGVLMGGMSSEREISLKSGRLVSESLKRLGYDAIAVDMDRDVGPRLRQEKIDAVFIALHGRYGEDGAIQGLLEIMGIPYTGSGVMASAIGMDKTMTKRLLIAHQIPTPAYVVLKSGTDLPTALAELRGAGLKPPWVVKPAAQGSTIGVSVGVEPETTLADALKRAFHHDSTALVEAFIEGREVTAGILNHRSLPLVEIVPKTSFYDYDTKTTSGMAEYKVPAPLAASFSGTLQEMSLNVYRILGCRGAARVDLRVDFSGRPYVLEINTVPGMTESSLLPMAAREAGIGYDALVEQILKSALRAGEE
jgi:D-alanine-D-alanine ligase